MQVMESDGQYGPALPPGLSASSTSSTSVDQVKAKRHPIGPALPPGMQKSSDSDDLSDEGPLTVKMDPEVSPEYQDDDVEDTEGGTVGPLPSEMSQEGDHTGQTAEDFERRSKRMKDKLTVKAEAEEGPSKREEWMTELPPEMGKNFGLQNRTFSKGGGGASEESKDRSAWTDTPIKKEKEIAGKGKKRKREEDKGESARDQQLQQQVDDYNKNKRPDSLLEIHAKKQKKKKKKEKKEKKKRKEKGEKEAKEARRPFDRDLDLKVNQFDDAQRQSIIKKSALLNTRFHKGATTSHFL